MTPEVGVLWRGGRYSLEEVTALVEGYGELRFSDTKAWILVRLIDMRRAMAYLSREHREAVILCGLHGLSTRVASPYLRVSHTTVAKRYAQGLEIMVKYMNGERY